MMDFIEPNEKSEKRKQALRKAATNETPAAYCETSDYDCWRCWHATKCNNPKRLED